MKEDVLIEVEGLSKKFCKDLKTSLWYGLKDVTTNAFGRKAKASLRPKEFWALKDVNFQLKRGECLGLIGHNGAGKSTLLKILNGLIKPDEGTVTIRGKVGALIELGAGFNPILTGRENIYNNGAVLGFSKTEIDAKLEAIIDFAEIREFIDMPVQNYSSGMKVRLGFAVASQMEPDVLIIDEVLAVGDVAFRAKCFNVLEQLIKKCAVILVSHSMPQVARICTRIILLKNGKLLINQTNNLGLAIEEYYSLVGKSEESVIGSGKAKLKDLRINSNFSDEVTLDYNLPFEIELNLDVDDDVREISVRLTFFDAEQKPVAQISSKNDKIVIDSKGEIKLKVKVDKLFLNIGKYTLHMAIYEVNDFEKESGVLFLSRSAKSIIVKGNSYYAHAPCLISGDWNFKCLESK